MSKLQADMIPLESKGAELAMSVQTLEGEKSSLEQTVEHWRQRSVSLTEKYNREKVEDSNKHGYVIVTVTEPYEQYVCVRVCVSTLVVRMNSLAALMLLVIPLFSLEKEQLRKSQTSLNQQIQQLTADLATAKEGADGAE